MKLSWIKYIFVSIFMIVALFCFKNFKQEISKDFVLSNIQLPLVKNIEDNKLSINKIDISAQDQDLIVNLLFDLDIKNKVTLKDIQAITKVNYKIDFYDKNIYLTIKDFDILNIGDTESKSKVINSILGVMKDTITNSINDKSAFISNVFNLLLKKPVYQLTGYKAFFLNDIKIKETVNSFNFVIELNTFSLSVPLIIISILLMLKEIGLFFILIYQKFISPRKGYRCAKAHYTGGDSCSESVRKVMKEKGFLAGMEEYFKTTKECKSIYEKNKYVRDTDTKSNCCSSNSSSNNTAKNSSFCNEGPFDCDILSDCSVGHKSCDIGDCSHGGCDIGHC